MTDVGRATCNICGDPATAQALYRRSDGSHFLGIPTCDVHRYRLGPLDYARWYEIVSYVEVVV